MIHILTRFIIGATILCCCILIALIIIYFDIVLPICYALLVFLVCCLAYFIGCLVEIESKEIEWE
jgi:hypothetical protein